MHMYTNLKMSYTSYQWFIKYGSLEHICHAYPISLLFFANLYKGFLPPNSQDPQGILKSDHMLKLPMKLIITITII